MNRDKYILIGKTHKHHSVYICDQCTKYPKPHLLYEFRVGLKKHTCALCMEDAKYLDGGIPLDLPQRRDLQAFLTANNWEKILSIWNAHNAHRLPMNTHVPYYINLQEQHGIAMPWHAYSDDIRAQRDMLYIVTDDADQRPHFHYGTKEGNDVAISLFEPRYFEPVREKLSQERVAKITALMQMTVHGKTGYALLLDLWEDNNGETPAFSQWRNTGHAPDYDAL